MTIQNSTDSNTAIEFDVRAFGATGDGVTDDTAAIQCAIDAAGRQGGGAVWFSPGIYAVGTLRVHSYVGLLANPTWSYRGLGATVLRLIDAAAGCMIDLTGSLGARVVGLSLDGGYLGEAVRGIYLDGAGHEQEDMLFIERTRIANFSGDGIRLDHVWCFTVRNCMMMSNKGDGLAFAHWDGWITENQFSGNEGYGIHAVAPNASISIVANRIEWNHKGGVMIERGSHYHINDNYIDRSGGPGIMLQGIPERRGHTYAITGNVIYRSGARAEPASPRSSHLLFEHVAGLVCTGNSMNFGSDDGGGGARSPQNGIVVRGLVDSIVSNNTLFQGAIAQLVVDEGEHSETTIVRDNIGSLAPPLA